MPTVELTSPDNGYSIEVNGNVSFLFRVIDSFGEEIYAEITTEDQMIAGSFIDVKVNAQYSMQTSEIGNKITELRIERRKKLNEDENDMLLDALKSLNETIKEYEPNGEFDENLFEQIVEKIVVDESSRITFHLIGGLTLTEEIKEKGRCKTA